LITLHGWIEFTGALQRGGWNSRASTHLTPAMAALARAYAGDAAKPVWLQEFGASGEWIGGENIAPFLEASVRAAIAGGICQITWWASHDIRPGYEFKSQEYDMGLISVDNKLKPAGAVFQKLAKEFSGKPVSLPALGSLPELPAHTPEDTWKWLEAVQKTLP
jgi:hypothetical protein